MRASMGVARSSATFEDLRRADVVLVLRGDPARTHPLVKTDLVQGIKQRGQKVILAHALSGGLERHATIFVPLAPAGEELFLHAVTARLLMLEPGADNGLRSVHGFDSWRASLSAYEMVIGAKWVGADGRTPERLESVVDLLRRGPKVATVVVTGRGIPGDEAAVARAAVTLNALLGVRGAGVLVLGEKANVQGLVDAGIAPLSIGSEPGPAADVLYVAGEDPLGTWPRGAMPPETVRRAAFVIVHDAFMSETAQSADVVLPVAVLAERNGSLVGADGVRRTLRAAVPVPSGVPQDSDILVELGRRLNVPLASGTSLACEIAADAPSGTPRELRVLTPAPTPAVPDRHPGILVDGSPQLFRSGSITERSPTLQELAPSVALRVSPQDAANLGIANGEPVRLSAGGREALLRARLDGSVRPGAVLAHWRVRRQLASSELPDTAIVAADIRRSQ
jgi:predicted molibdopterin-dependent oxidoreductase YjgC